MTTAKVFSKTTSKLAIGTKRPQNKVTPEHNSIWEFATTTAKVSSKTTNKPSSGSKRLQNKE